MQKQNLSFLPQELFPLSRGRGDWVTWKGPSPGSRSARWPLGRARPQPRPSASCCRKSAAGSAAAPAEEGGLERGCLRLPGELVSQARGSYGSGPGLCPP